MGKGEIDMQIRYHEALLESYVRLSRQPFVDKERVAEKMEKIRVILSSLYTKRESLTH